MNSSPLLADPDVLSLERIDLTGETVILEVSACRPCVPCPGCQEPSSSIHSHYQRIPQDLPWQGVAVKLKVQTRRFFCCNSACLRRIFCERLGSAVAFYARRTLRLTQALKQVSFAVGGEAGERLTALLGYGFGADTLLSVVRKAEQFRPQTPRVLGVDDWSFCKGKTFGTILVDLEQNRVIDLLPDRTATTFSAWLKAHPGVEVVSRDPSSDYALAVKEAAPAAVQVADRWHLFKNLGDVLEAWLGRHRAYLTEEVVTDSADENAAVKIAATWQLTPTQAEARKASRTKRVAQFETATQMREQGFSSAAIASEVGISIRTLRRWSMMSTLPERKRTSGRPSILDPYKLYIEKRWREGCEKPRTLWREVTDQGFSGSSILVSNYLIYLRNRTSESHTAAPTPTLQKRYLPREAAVLFTCPEGKLGEVGKARLKKLLEACPDARHCYDLAQQFTEMLRQKDPQPFEAWLKEALASSVTELRRFANGIRLDKAAVEAALTLPYSNGQVEGQVNRLKLIKRSMYGRANFDLLRARVLHVG